MANTQVQICNLALARVADEGAQITSLIGSSREVRLCNLFYEPALRETIRLHPWNCAIKRAKLGQLSSEPVFEFSYSYQLPTNFIRVLEVSNTASTWNRNHKQIEYQIEGRKLITNESDIYIKYVSYISDPNEMESLFMKCFYTVLASKLVMPLTEDEALRNSIENEIQNIILPEARSIDAQEGYQREAIQSDVDEARYQNGYYTGPFAQSDYGTF